jgi:hypothetical protein
VAERIRRSPPLGSYVVTGSTPVISFGNVQTARVATLGLNPSRIEFIENGTELTGERRRFETLQSLGVTQLEDATDATIFQVWKRCNDYFHGNPYRWFAPLEEILSGIGVFYFGDTACHLDLFQWATDPTWGGLPAPSRRKFILDDAEFLRTQLQLEVPDLLLLNGRSVIDAFRSTFGGQLNPDGTVTDRSVTTKIYVGDFGNTHVVGWSTNLQSSFGVTKELRALLAQRVAEIAT